MKLLAELFSLRGRLSPGGYCARVVLGLLAVCLLLPLALFGTGTGLGDSVRILEQFLTGDGLVAGPDLDARIHAGPTELMALRYVALLGLLLLALLAFLAASAQRLHDAGRRAAWLWLLLFPGVNLPVVFVVLCFLPTEREDGAYGPVTA